MIINTEYVWENFHNDLLRFINRRINNNEISKDILQDVFEKIHLKLNTLTDKDKLTSWIYQITRNRILDFLKKHKPDSAIINDYMNEDDEEIFNHEMSVCMLNLIKKLPENYRNAIQKIDLEQLSQKEYARLSGLSYSGSRSRVQRSRKELHELFRQCCIIQTDKYGNIVEFEKISIQKKK